MNNEALERFYERLEEAKGFAWRVSKDGVIRSDSHDSLVCACPLHVLSGFTGGSTNVWSEALGLTKSDGWIVAYAADNIHVRGNCYRESVRARMLSILNLQEVQP